MDPKMDGVSNADLRRADREIRGEACFTPLVLESAICSANIGVNFNNWRPPVSKFGPCDSNLQERLKRMDCIGDFNIKGTDWERARRAVDVVLDLLLKEIRAIVERRKYERLSIQKYVKQGSSREGLKVREANEFDTVLQFELQGIKTQVELVKGQPELGMVRLLASPGAVEKACPTLWQNNVFFTDGKGGCFLSSKEIHERVFESLIDSAADNVEEKINSPGVKDDLSYRITRSMNPPSVNITIVIEEKSEDADGFGHLYNYRFQGESGTYLEGRTLHKIDVDVVPGIVVAMDDVPDPSGNGCSMKCPKYAVFKWMQESQSIASAFKYPQHIWRICSSGYEKHIFDVCQIHNDQKYIITADRILKTYFSKAKESRSPPPQLVTVLRSYHLKMITFYCLLYLTVINKKNLKGVKEGLAYLLAFLEVCLEEECLPNFFHGNGWILYMFPDYGCEIGDLKINMLKYRSKEAMNQARRSFREMKQSLHDLNLPDIVEEYVDKFRDFVRTGDYA